MESIQKGFLFVISGPSGAGKSAICAGLVMDKRVAVSVSMTTRLPRTQEIEGISYYFVSKEQFGKVLDEDGFIEHAEVFGEYYGTPKRPVQEQLGKGIDVILEIDVNGAIQVKESMPRVVLIFIIPPSPLELRRRIEGRGTEPEERIAERLKRSDLEISQLGKYDYCVVNEELGKAIKDVKMIMKAEKAFANNYDLNDCYEFSLSTAIQRAEKLRIKEDWEKIIERYKAG